MKISIKKKIGEYDQFENTRDVLFDVLHKCFCCSEMERRYREPIVPAYLYDPVSRKTDVFMTISFNESAYLDDTDVGTGAEYVIHYCPFCGKKIEVCVEAVEDLENKLREIEIRHEEFMSRIRETDSISEKKRLESEQFKLSREKTKLLLNHY